MSVYTLATPDRHSAGLGTSPGVGWSQARTHRPVAALVRCHAADRFWAWLLVAFLLPTLSLPLITLSTGLQLPGLEVPSRVVVGMELMMLAEVWGATRLTSQFRDGTVTSSVAQHRGVTRLVVHHALAVVPGCVLLACAGMLGATATALALQVAGLDTALIGPGYWPSELGMLAVTAQAAPIGICVAWVLRGARSCAFLIVLWALAVHPLLEHLLPDAVASSLPLGLSALLFQGTGPGASPWLAVLLLTWTVVLTTASILLTQGRDLGA